MLNLMLLTTLLTILLVKLWLHEKGVDAVSGELVQEQVHAYEVPNQYHSCRLRE
jgi:competence protein ComGC